jgi:hypothetical protein
MATHMLRPPSLLVNAQYAAGALETGGQQRFIGRGSDEQKKINCPYWKSNCRLHFTNRDVTLVVERT